MDGLSDEDDDDWDDLDDEYEEHGGLAGEELGSGDDGHKKIGMTLKDYELQVTHRQEVRTNSSAGQAKASSGVLAPMVEEGPEAEETLASPSAVRTANTDASPAGKKSSDKK